MIIIIIIIINTSVLPIKTNNTSIVCLVIFPGSGRVSYYLAGDADGELELRVAAWIGDITVTTMKLSHHGSATSSPLRLLKLLKPKTILVSAGDQHGHPSELSVIAG